MNRKTLGALLVFLVLLGIVYYLQTKPEKGERIGERQRPLAKLKADQIKKVTITAKNTSVELVRKDKETWRLLKPIDDEADEAAVKSMVSKLEALEFGDLVTELKAKHTEYQVDDAAGIRVAVSDGSRTLADFYLGKSVESFTMLRVAGKDAVWQAVGSLRFAFEREIKNWRDRRIIEFKRDDARKLQVTTEAGSVTLSRPDASTPWKPDSSPVKLDQLDTSVISTLLSSLSSLRAFDFADDIKPDRSGLDQPRATLTVDLDGGQQVTLLVGTSEKDDIWVQKKGSPRVFVLKKSSADNLLKRPVDFRDKTVLSFKKDDVIGMTITKLAGGKDSLTLAKKGDDWLGNGKKVQDPKKISGALDTLSSLKAQGFARLSPKEMGMDKPGWSIEVRLKDRSKHLLTVGSVDNDGLYGLSRKGLSDLFVFRKYTLDRFLLDPKDYK